MTNGGPGSGRGRFVNPSVTNDVRRKHPASRSCRAARSVARFPD